MAFQAFDGSNQTPLDVAEVKRDDAPRITASMRIALEDVKLDHLTILYPGLRRYSLDERVTVVPFAALASGNPREVAPGLKRR